MSLKEAETKMKTEKDNVVSAKLDVIESEMKKINYWSETPPEFECTSFLDAPSFELWLQCVFLPNARHAASTGEYPANSAVGDMARRQYNYHSFVPRAQLLSQLLYEFDEIIMSS